MKSRLFLPWSLLVGLFLLTSNVEAARATTLILGKSKPEPKIDIAPTAEEENVPVSEPASSNLSNETVNVGNVTKLTGVPQIDYIYDPNLPRELNGYNLTDYPFYNSIPEEIDFKCDGLHDGFYASVPHKCQVYHHCLFGTRYDFLCANYTAFDQKTFICHFASEVDCKNSPRYFNRNEALYKATTTTTISPFGSSPLAGRRPSDSHGGRRRRPYSRKRKPSYEYDDEYEDVEDDYYDDGSVSGRRRKRPRPINGRESYDDAEEDGEGDKTLPPSGPNKSIFDRPRIAPKIRRPVPINEREKYDYSSDSRAIIKEPEVEKKRYEDSESKKQTSSRGTDNYESTGNKYSKNVEPDTEREREREHKLQDDYESNREREREKEREREREKDRERERERERERDRDRDERPYRDRRPPKRRRRPDGLDDYYDDYEDSRRYRNRNRPRYEEYDDYEYDDRPYRYRPRDHERDHEREKPYRNRDSDYRPSRNRDRYRDDDRPVRNRDIDDRPVRNRDEERPSRNRDEERPFRNRDSEKPILKDQDDRLNRNRNEQFYRNEGRNNKNRNTDERPYYNGDEDKYRERDQEEYKKTKETYRDEQVQQEKPYNYRETGNDNNGKHNYPDSGQQDRDRNQDRPSRVPDGSYSNGRLKLGEQSDRFFQRNNERGTARPGNVQNTRNPPPVLDPEEINPEDQSKPVPASRPAYITKHSEEVTQAPRKTFNDQRKTNGFKRPFLTRVPSTQEEPLEEQYNPRPLTPEELPIQIRDQYENRPHDGPKYQEERYQQENSQPQTTSYNPSVDIRGAMELNDKLQPTVNSDESDFNSQRLRVPHEDSVPKEELAPKAPKFPQTSPRRRPFLPSRNGNANLPRNLLPVGVKALQTPRGFQTSNKKSEEGEQDQKTEGYAGIVEKERQDSKYKIPESGGIEFRAKVSTAIGVDQPKLTQYFQDVQSSSELELPEYEENPQNPGPSGIDAEYFSSVMQKQEKNNHEEPRPFFMNPSVPHQRQAGNTQDLSSSQVVHEYSQEQVFRPESSPNINFRPTMKPTDFPQLSNTNSPPGIYPQVQENRNREPFRNRPPFNVPNQGINNFAPKTPISFPSPSSKPSPLPQGQLQIQPQVQPQLPKQPQPQPIPPTQLGPQSFYSENPKFKTTIKVPEPIQYKPPGSTINFNPSSQLPVYQSGFRQNLPSSKQEPVRYETSQRQIDSPQENLKHLNLKFPSQNENLDDTDEYDVSLNDALQPISSLHPRNVLTGVYLSNWQRNQQPFGGFKRRAFQESAPSRQTSDSDEVFEPKLESPQRVAAVESRNVPNPNKNQKLTAQRQAPSTIHQRYVRPPMYLPRRPVTGPGKYLEILTK